MLAIINSVLRRELKIIQYLYENKGLHPIKDLMELTGVTEKTIRADIHRINKDFPRLHIEKGVKSQVELKCSDHVGLEYVYRKTMESAIRFQFLESLLVNGNRPIHFYVENLFISESFVRKLVHEWNRAFKRNKFDISITTSNALNIEGDEILIRQVYSCYLMEKYGGDFQHEALKFNSSWELVSTLAEHLSLKLTYAERMRVSYWVFICIQRMKVGYFIKKTASKQDKDKIAKILYDKISKDASFMGQFLKDYQIRLSAEVLTDILEVFRYDFLISGEFPNNSPIYEQKDNSLTMDALRSFLLSFLSSVHCENTFSEWRMAAIYSSMSFRMQITFFFYDHYGEFKKYVKRVNPLFLHNFEIHLENSDIASEMKENDNLKNELLYYIVIYMKLSLENLPKLKKQKTLLILTTHHTGFDKLMKEKIDNEFAGYINTSLYQAKQFQFDIEYLKQFDLILTNYDHIPEELQSRILYLDSDIPSVLFEKIKIKLGSE